MAYPAVSDLKTYLGTSSATEDTLLGVVLNAAIAWVEAWCGHDFVADSAQTIKIMPDYPNLMDRARRVLLVRNWEIISVTSITNGDGEVVAAADYTLLPLSGPPYYKIELHADSGLYWTRGSDGAGFVTIVASSLGYTADVPNDVKLAILQIAAYMYRARGSGTAGKVATATRQGLVIQPDELPATSLQLLWNYRRVRG